LQLWLLIICQRQKCPQLANSSQDTSDLAFQRSKAGFCKPKKKMKDIDFLLDNNQIKFNIVKEEQCFLKNILCKDS